MSYLGVRPWLIVCSALLVVSCSDCFSPVKPVDPCAAIEGNQKDHPGACSSTNDCADHYKCQGVPERESLQCCLLANRQCNSEDECCPGQICATTRGKRCIDQYDACDQDSDCGDQGDRFCETWTDAYGASKRCRYQACSTLGECAPGLSCFKGECMAEPPCGGACAPGQACVPSARRCQSYACAVSCAPGRIATFTDTRNIWDSCQLPSVGCDCPELPGLSSPDLGRHSSAAADPQNQELVVSMYDGAYGDLVVNRYSLDGRRVSQQYVDGVPSGVEPRYGRSGARGGVAEPGLDVGRYTDVAVGAQATYVSYYDASNGDLKLALQASGAKTWQVVKVDGTLGDVGLYSSVALDADGLPGVAYFQKGGLPGFKASDCPTPYPSGDPALITALKFAKAKTAAPQKPEDFTFYTLACQSRPAEPCETCTNECVDPGTGTPSCHPAASGCSGCDPQTEACVQLGGRPLCAKRRTASKIDDLPEGAGLFASLAFSGNDAYVAYARRSADPSTRQVVGRLYGVKIPSNATRGQAPVLLDSTGDTGYFADLKVHPRTKQLLISYHDATSRALKLFQSASFLPNLTSEIIDSGVGAPGSGEVSWVGTDSALVVTPAGKIFAVYQDSTRGDLRISVRDPSWRRQAPVRTAGAVGFYADAVAFGEQLYATHASIQARVVNAMPRVETTLLVDKVPGP